MRPPKELMVPISVVKELNEMHYQHLKEFTSVLEQHLEKVASLYERALNPPAVASTIEGPLFLSEEQEDEAYLIARAEQRALEEQQKEAAAFGGDIKLQ